MGIPHIEDLTPDELEDVMAGMLRVTSKVDGSFLAFGFDEDFRFYTERKGGQRFYSLDDWSLEGWAVGFRQAHMVLENFMDFHRDIGKAGRYARATSEIIWGTQPNVVEYTYSNSVIIHPGANFNSESFATDVALSQVVTDGVTGWTEQRYVKWRVTTIGVRDWKDFPIKEANTILDWLALPSKVKPYTKRQILGFKFNGKPVGYTKEAWRTTLPLLKEERGRIREAYTHRMGCLRRECLVSLNSNLHYETVDAHTKSEGFVISTVSGRLVKIINREWFKPANDFVHWVRYALIGGRRPARPSFSSRTMTWSKDRKLARLEVLRHRYLDNRDNLKFEWRGDLRVGNLTYSDEIHERVLMLFYDLRQRIENGRAGIQGNHEADLPSRDSTDLELVRESASSPRINLKIPA
jgi:hypothetical protein